MASRTVLAARRLMATVPLREAPIFRTFATSSRHQDATSSSTVTNSNTSADAAAATARRPFQAFRSQMASSSSSDTTQSPPPPPTEPAVEPKKAEPEFEIPQCLLPTQKQPYKFKHHVATLQLRCYTAEVQEMDRFADFCRKAAYAIGIRANGTVALPTRVRLWTVPKGPFVHKKAQENFWRRTHSRSIKLYDANPEVVDRWLLFLRIHAVPGVGMKAQLIRYYEPGVGTRMTKELEAKQLSIADRIGTPKAQEQATTAQTADQIKEIAQGIVREEMDKLDSEPASTEANESAASTHASDKPQ